MVEAVDRVLGVDRMPRVGRMVVGADLGGSKLSAVLVDSAHTVVHHIWLDRPGAGLPALVAALEAAVAECRAVAAGLGGEVGAVGLAVAGWLSADREHLVWGANLGARDHGIGADLRRRLQLPVVIDNDGNATALGEFRAAGPGAGVHGRAHPRHRGRRRRGRGRAPAGRGPRPGRRARPHTRGRGRGSVRLRRARLPRALRQRAGNCPGRGRRHQLRSRRRGTNRGRGPALGASTPRGGPSAERLPSWCRWSTPTVWSWPGAWPMPPGSSCSPARGQLWPRSGPCGGSGLRLRSSSGAWGGRPVLLAQPSSWPRRRGQGRPAAGRRRPLDSGEGTRHERHQQHARAQLRLGVVGAGRIAQVAHLPAATKADRVRLVAVCDSSPLLVGRVAQRYERGRVHRHGPVPGRGHRCRPGGHARPVPPVAGRPGSGGRKARAGGKAPGGHRGGRRGAEPSGPPSLGSSCRSGP